MTEPNDSSHPNRGVKIAHLNTRSLSPKLDSIKLWIDDAKYDVITLNETWLAPDIPTSSLDLNDYEVIRQDRNTGKREGGLMILLRKDKNIVYNESKYLHLNV